MTTITGWWWLEQFLFSDILGISSSQLTFIFFRGVEATNQIITIVIINVFGFTYEDNEVIFASFSEGVGMYILGPGTYQEQR